MKRVFTIERTADYSGDVGATPEELASAKYIVYINNGDWHLLNTVQEIRALIEDELWLAGFSDD